MDGWCKAKFPGGSLLFFVRGYSIVVICVFSFLVYSFSFLGMLFFFLFFYLLRERQTRREPTILDERIQNFPFLSFIGHGSMGGRLDMKKKDVGLCVGGIFIRLCWGSRRGTCCFSHCCSSTCFVPIWLWLCFLQCIVSVIN